MGREAGRRDDWKALTVAAAVVAPVSAILWLGMTLTSEPASLSIAVVKIVFTILTVLAAIAGLKWLTAGGITLAIGALLAALWVVVRAPYYPPYGALRTVLLLIVPLAASAVMLVLAGGIRAGTWPPAQARTRRSLLGQPWDGSPK